MVLNQDANGHDSQFIKNRDKFVTKLAETIRTIFSICSAMRSASRNRKVRGQKSRGLGQPNHASARPCQWPLSLALAQGYASTVYDDALHAKFLEKMNYMIDTLYDLSQKSGNPKEEGGPSNADPTKVPPGPTAPNRFEPDSPGNSHRLLELG